MKQKNAISFEFLISRLVRDFSFLTSSCKTTLHSTHLVIYSLEELKKGLKTLVEYSDTEHDTTISRKIHSGMMASPDCAKRKATWEEIRPASRHRHNMWILHLWFQIPNFQRFPFSSENVINLKATVAAPFTVFPHQNHYIIAPDDLSSSKAHKPSNFVSCSVKNANDSMLQKQ